MTVTVDSFRTAFPEFGDAAAYPDATVEFWLSLAGKMLRPDAWGDLLDYGTQLFVAHNLVQSAQAVKSAAAGGAPGASSGITSAKSVDKVSVSYDTGSALIDGAGNWDLTTYGTRYIQLARLVGAGGIQL